MMLQSLTLGILRAIAAGQRIWKLGLPGPLPEGKIKIRVVLKCSIIRVKEAAVLVLMEQCLLAVIV